jgi:hypothetical protein
MNENNPSVTTMRATKLPPGKALFEAAGVSSSKERLLEFATTMPSCPPEIEAMLAPSIGLEFWFDGSKTDWGENYLRDKWVIVHPAAVEDKC